MTSWYAAQKLPLKPAHLPHATLDPQLELQAASALCSNLRPQTLAHASQRQSHLHIFIIAGSADGILRPSR